MYREVIVCNDCEHFVITQDGMTMCDNKEGIPFPGINDYCSRGKLSSKSQKIDSMELLKLVYEQKKTK